MPRLFPLILALVVAALYAGTMRDPFIFDDPIAVAQNPSIRHFTTALRPGVDVAGATGRPVFNVTLAANYALGGVAPEGYHLVNAALHGLCALLLLGLVRRTVGDGGEWIGWVAALAWATHPLVTSAVNPINQRSEVLASLFILLALYGFVRGWLWVSFGACLLGMGSKEIAWAIPVLVLLYDRAFLGGSFGKRKGFYLSMFSCWAVLVALMFTTGHRDATVGFGLGASAWDYLLTQCRALGIYAKLAVWPHPLVNDYGTTLVHSFGEVAPQAIMILALLGSTVAGVVDPGGRAQRARLQRMPWRPQIAFASATCFLLLAPSSSFIPIVTEPIGEQRAYLPLALAIAVAVVLTYRLGGRRALAIWAVPILAGSAMTLARNRDYRAEPALLWQDLAANPANDRAYLNLGTLATRQGDWVAAARDYRLALTFNPKAADAHFNLGVALEHLNDRRGAIAELTQAATLRPAYPVALRELGLQLAQDGQFEPAAAALEKAYALQPSAPKLRDEVATIQFDLGVMDAQGSRFASARTHFARTLELRPSDEPARRNLDRLAGILGP